MGKHECASGSMKKASTLLRGIRWGESTQARLNAELRGGEGPGIDGIEPGEPGGSLERGRNPIRGPLVRLAHEPSLILEREDKAKGFRLNSEAMGVIV
jgi:hypothetical protein